MQTQLQMATSNPPMHNMHEAYRRMYQALGVRDIDMILPPPQQPQPEDPAMENSKSLTMRKLQDFQDFIWFFYMILLLTKLQINLQIPFQNTPKHLPTPQTFPKPMPNPPSPSQTLPKPLQNLL